MTLTNGKLTQLLDRLLAGWGNEVVEFKEPARQFSEDKTGEYVSAPALNEALTESQKATRTTNLLTKRRRHGAIVNCGTRSKPSYADDGSVPFEPADKKDDGDSGDARAPGSA